MEGVDGIFFKNENSCLALCVCSLSSQVQLESRFSRTCKVGRNIPERIPMAELSESLDYLTSDDLAPLFWVPKRTQSAWDGHIPFAHWLVHVARPRTLVELGTHTGVSYSAFCNAVARSRTETKCFAVDAWKGDKHSGFYGEEIFDDFRQFNDQNFGNFSTLLRTEFDVAVEQFEDGEIDVLHIDGLHTYEAVRHDFETWLPKLSPQAVVLLHDTNERRDDFGVWRFWSELKDRYPAFEFLHSHGLGVLCVGRSPPGQVMALCSLESEELIDAIRRRFEAAGRLAEGKTTAAKKLQDELSAARRTIRTQNEQASSLRDALKAEHARASADRDMTIGQLEEKVAAQAKLEKMQAMRITSLSEEVRRVRSTSEAIRDSTSWRLTRPLRGLALAARASLRHARAIAGLPDQWPRVARLALRGYQRRVPIGVKKMVPRAWTVMLKNRIEDAGPKSARGLLPSVRTRWATFKQDRHRQSVRARPSSRIAIFAAYSEKGVIHEHVLYYLKELRKVADKIIFVADNDIGSEELSNLAGISTHNIVGRHGEYDFGSYKRGYMYAKRNGWLDKGSDLIICNDSCFGPVDGFSKLFSEMTMHDYDFWGITESQQYKYHLQSYFLCFASDVYRSEVFENFFLGIKKHDSVEDVIRNYELRLTKLLIAHGFRAKAYIGQEPPQSKTTQKHVSIEHLPCFMIENGSPLLKVKSLSKARCNLDGMTRTFELLRKKNPKLFEKVTALPDTKRFLDCDNVAFSIIMPTLNRAHCIDRAIDSVLSQTHRRFELIIVDDGSTDGTGQIIEDRYRDEIASGRIVHFPSQTNRGVSAARNRGLDAARNEWIAYVDTDNTIRPSFLSVFAQHIVEFPETKTFHAQFQRTNDRAVIGKPFDRAELLKGNFIDLGVFVHHRSCTELRGGFDENLNRLVDWDLILNYTDAYPSQYIPHVLMDYTGDPEPDRISVKEQLGPAWFHVLEKQKRGLKVSTVILCYNQRQYVAEAIDSALRQQGKFSHEIVVSDDGSTDGTREIVRDYARKYPKLIRDVSRQENYGISGNYRHGLSAATGDFVAILEGDDYWLDDRKLEAQVAFLLQNRDCSMVFSKIQVHNMKNATVRTLARQDALKTSKLSGRNFLDHPSMNLIGTFSTCMFRREILESFPPVLFEHRISEIPVAFFHDRHGKIGYLGEPMTLYRQHAAGVWSSSSKADQLRSGRETRLTAKAVAADAYRDEIQRVLDERFPV
jgi:glycosyltransferase involved in cell wall biosynthesis